MMKNKEDWKFDKKRAVSALQNLSYHILNPLNDDNVFELVRLINHCEDLEKALDKACEELEDFDMTFNNADYNDVKNKQEWKEWLKENA